MNESTNESVNDKWMNESINQFWTSIKYTTVYIAKTKRDTEYDLWSIYDVMQKIKV